MVEPGALAGDGRQASGAEAEWAGGGAHADMALGWRREEVRARLVSGAGAEWGGGWWGGGVRADLTLGRRREKAGACSFFFLLGCAVGQRCMRRSGAGGHARCDREEEHCRPLGVSPRRLELSVKSVGGSTLLN
jgi:hypothetical protein